MFLELCSGGDLHAWLNAHTVSSEPESRYIGYQLILGLEVSVDPRGNRMTEDPVVFAFESNCSPRQVPSIRFSVFARLVIETPFPRSQGEEQTTKLNEKFTLLL
jgi:hypothetical protein